MRQIFLKSLTLINYKGHKDLTIDFTSTRNIYGDNATGKSTIPDAFGWLFDGKDIFGRENFEIYPIVNGKALEKVDSEVSAVFEIDSRELIIRRVFTQNWVRPKGQSEEVFKGNETHYYWNDVPKKVGEYKALIDATFNESIFKLLTNPATFLSLHWTKQREMLFNIAGSLTNAEILDKMATLGNKDAIANLTNILNSGKALVDFKKEISARKKKLKEQLEDIQPRIDQTVRLMPEKKDFAAIEREIAEIDKQIKAIDDQLADRAKAIRAQYDTIQEQQGQINGLKTSQTTLLNRLKTEAQQEADEANQELTIKQGQLSNEKIKLANAKQNLSTINSNLASLQGKVESKNKQIVALRQKWTDENEKQYEAKEGCLVCPVFGTDCGDPQATIKHSEAQEKAKQAFFEAKDEKLKAINKDGLALKEELGELISDQNKSLEDQTAAMQTVAEIEKTVNSLILYLDENKPVSPLEIDPKNVVEWVELQNKIDEIEKSIVKVESADNSDLTGTKEGLNTRRDALNKSLNDKDLIVKYNKEVADLKLQGSDLAQQIADLEKQEFSIDEFTKIRIDECERRVNSMFEIVKFKLFNKTNEGNEFECCIATNKAGVPISATNTAEKINAGLDIIRTLSNFYNVSAPIFCDGSESVNNYIETGSQMIFLRVTKDKVLRFETI